MKRFLQIAFATSFVMFAFIYSKAVYTKAVAANDKYVVPAKSNKYHYPSCRFAQRSGSKDLATFQSAKDARGAGYIPCKVCKPPIDD